MKWALVTGANRGLGLELAHALYGAGYHLILHSRITQILECLEWDEVRCVFGDLRDMATIERLREAAQESGGRLDVLINNAGTYLGGDFAYFAPCEITNTFHTNVIAPVLLTQALWPFLVKAQGVVVNISSLAATGPGPGETVYGATKAGLSCFSDGLQYEATRERVRVINVTLGGLNTGMTAHRKDRDKMIDPAEAANFIVRLAGQDYATMRITNVELKRRIY
jgi:short-subunit dehydrogenase